MCKYKLYIHQLMEFVSTEDISRKLHQNVIMVEYLCMSCVSVFTWPYFNIVSKIGEYQRPWLHSVCLLYLTEIVYLLDRGVLI